MGGKFTGIFVEHALQTIRSAPSKVATNGESINELWCQVKVRPIKEGALFELSKHSLAIASLAMSSVVFCNCNSR